MILRIGSSATGSSSLSSLVGMESSVVGFDVVKILVSSCVE